MSQTISWEEVQAWMHEGKPFLLVDVRESDEVMMGALPGARHIPLGTLDQYAAMVLPDKNATIVCYCMSGRRSQAAVRRLTELGYTDVTSLADGYLGTKGAA